MAPRMVPAIAPIDNLAAAVLVAVGALLVLVLVLVLVEKGEAVEEGDCALRQDASLFA